MYKIYLVCTRAAISASALAYIINQSPDFYNTPHNTVWDEEPNDLFGTAYTINDWWNITDNMKSKLNYDKDFRNTVSLTEKQLLDLTNGFNELGLGKNICLFAHARNISELKNYITKHNLPIVLISTMMGNKCGMFINSWIKREYSNEMNKFRDLFDTWEYLFTQRLSRDKDLAKHADNSFTMYDWLIDTQKVYKDLNIAECTNISQWTEYYLDKNNNSVTQLEDTCKKLSTMLHLYDALENYYPQQHDKVTLCYNLFEMVHSSNNTDIETLQEQYHKTY